MTAIDVYRACLPEPDLLETELLRYKQQYAKQPADNRPATCAVAMKDICSNQFPNICALLRIACTLPVSSCECEHSASVLRRLHTWTRETMGQNRVGSLALIHTHYGYSVDLDKVVDIFAKKTYKKNGTKVFADVTLTFYVLLSEQYSFIHLFNSGNMAHRTHTHAHTEKQKKQTTKREKEYTRVQWHA